jgi:hypothetical protein
MMRAIFYAPSLTCSRVGRGLQSPATAQALRPILAYSHQDLHTTSYLSTEDHGKSVENLIDRAILKPEHSEQTKSGTNDEVASHPASFDPSTTSPESVTDATRRETEGGGTSIDPLSASPANLEISKSRDPMEGGAEHNVAKKRSAKGWTRKRKPVNVDEH